MSSTSTNISDFFDLSKEWNPPPQVVGRSMRMIKQKESISAESDWDEAPDCSSTEYARVYLEENNLQYFKDRRTNSTHNENTAMEDVSDLFSVPCLETEEEFEDENSSRVYNNYDFGTKNPESKKLAIYRHKEQILSAVSKNQVVIVEGFTGCGKTTQVPQYILDDCYEKRSFCNIVVTQPRRVAALSIAERVCDERKWDIGKVVGYQVALNKVASEDTKVIYVTTGVILETLVKKKSFGKITHLIVDEVHERDVEVDFLLIIVKMLLKTNRSVKVLLMSATMNADQFVSYFTLPNGDGNYDVPPVISVVSSAFTNFPVKVYYLEDFRSVDPFVVNFDVPMILPEQYNLAVRIVFQLDIIEIRDKRNRSYKSAVLVFLPGINEIQMLHKYLNEAFEERLKLFDLRQSDNVTPLEIIPLHSSISALEQKRAFKRIEGRRKVILSTNIAESSVTVPDVDFVIDFCLSKQLETDSESNFSSLKLQWASMNALQQRMGRCGRINSGKLYRLIPRDFVDEKLLPLQTTPALLRSPLEKSVLRAKELDFGKPERILALALNPPVLNRIRSCILSLKEVGAMLLTVNGEIDPDDGDLTIIGKIMSCLPLDIRLSKLIVLGYVFNVLEECIIMACGLSGKSIFRNSYKWKVETYCKKIEWDAGAFSDVIALMNAYREWDIRTAANEWQRSGGRDREMKFCTENYLEKKQLVEMKNQIFDVKKRLENFNIRPGRMPSDYIWPSDHEKTLVIKIALAGAFYPFYFLGGNGQDEAIWEDARKELDGRDPLTSVLFSGFPIEQSNYGDLYIQKIRDMLRTTRLLNSSEGSVQKVDVHFSKGSSKFIVDFRELVSHGGNSDVHPLVRKAVKMGKLRIPFQLDVKRAREADLLHKKWLKDCEEMRKNAQMSKNGQIFYCSMLPQLELPYVTKSDFVFEYAHYEDPHSFYATYTDAKFREQYAKLHTVMNSPEKPLTPLKGTPVLGQLVIAPFNGELFRAVVDEIKKDRIQTFIITVVYIDFGNKEEKKCNELFELDEGLIKGGVCMVPALALKCALALVKPLSLDGKWPPISQPGANPTVYVRHALENCQTFKAKVYSIVDSVLRLFVYTYGDGVSLNESLVKKNMAEKGEESYLSKENNICREQSHKLSKEECLQYEIKQRRDESSVFMLPTDIGTCTDKVFLKGPRSPIDIKLYGLSAGGTKNIQVDPESVNSVLFQQPGYKSERLIVAARVTTSQERRHLTAYSTTVLPAIPGLWAIVTMLFAPRIELRCDETKSRLTGAICGLGYDPDSPIAKPLFQDHDLELTFDVKITNEDIHTIDRLRQLMNIALDSTVGQYGILGNDRTTLFEIHSIIHDCLFGNKMSSNDIKTSATSKNYLIRHRKPISPQPSHNRGRWSMIESNDVLLASISRSFTEIYEMHNGLDLVKFDNIEEKLKHLSALTLAIKEGTSNSKKPLECPICNFCTVTSAKMKCHLESFQHIEMKSIYENL